MVPTCVVVVGETMETTKGKTTSATDYSKRTHHEQILEAPDTYIGSIEPQEDIIAVLDSTVGEGNEGPKMTQRPLTIVPGLFKIFDEILVNAADNKVRHPEDTDTIKVTFDEEGRISVFNNGRGIPVEMHPEYGVYAPELIFGHLLTSSNYKKSGKLTGGKNGLGAKLTNIYSREFSIETFDHQRGLKYKQSWSDNMIKAGKPKVTANKTLKTDYTMITFLPDYARFGLTGLDDDHRALFTRRVYDLTATLRNVKVFLNGERIKIKNFREYIKLYVGNDASVFYENVEGCDGRWEVAVAPNASGQFQHVSFVNSIYTRCGGAHVNHISKQIVNAVMEKIEKSKTVKAGVIKPYVVKNQMWLFINCYIEDPAFSSQTKEDMTSNPSKWGSNPVLSKGFVDKVLKSPIVMSTLEEIENKQNAMLKKLDGSKQSNLKGIDKLKDADHAGGRNAHKCTLFLTEGDSAKSMALAGLGALPFEDRKYYGVYPLRGKVLNVRDASVSSIMENKEITELKKILGLQQNKDYTDVKSLRYGKVVLFTDADADGAHIKALVINFFEHFYGSLLKLGGFLCEFITPIVKATRASGSGAPIVFYNLQEFEAWVARVGTKGYKIKYYKGLGTSTEKEAKEYFSDLNTHLKSFREMEKDDQEKLDLVFRKNRAEDRKMWLRDYDPKAFLDKSGDSGHTIRDFIDNELIHFSNYDNIRSIPRLMDGLKPSQRKVLYTLFKYPIAQGSELKVAQLSAKVAEKTEYHHGEVSLAQAIIGLAQDFCGSNNLPLLVPSGTFGSRFQGGADASSPRYIFTYLQPHTRLLFKEDDDALLRAQYEDNSEIEPEFFMPIIPMVLVNGAKGIGSGYSTDIPCFNVADIIDALMLKLDGAEASLDLAPYYSGFKGTVFRSEGETDKWVTRGCFEYCPQTRVLVITELPVGTWIANYKKVLDKLLDDVIEGAYRDNSTNNEVYYEVTLKREMSHEEIVRKFELESTFKTSNMVLFDHQFRLRKYQSVAEVFDEFYTVRLDGYVRRKAHLLSSWEKQLAVLSNKKRFIEGNLSGEIDLRNKDESAIEAELVGMGFDMVDGGFGYLLGMPLRSLTRQRVDVLLREHAAKQQEIDTLRARTPVEIWKSDLVALREALASYKSSSAVTSGSGTLAARASSKTASKRGRSVSGTSRDKKETKRSKLS